MNSKTLTDFTVLTPLKVKLKKIIKFLENEFKEH